MPDNTSSWQNIKKPDLDLVLTGGTVLDPLMDVHEIMEIGITGERIAAVGKSLARNAKTRVIDCRSLYVVPGLIDLHVHLFEHVQKLGINADAVMIKGGVTTMLDAGSAGPANWDLFKGNVIHRAKPRVLSLIHLCDTGLNNMPELLDPRHSNSDGAIEVIRKDPALVRGVKLRAGKHIIGDGASGWQHLCQAVHVARETGTRVMIHIGDTPMTLSEIAAKLEPGDLITHCFKGGSYGNLALDHSGRVYPELLQAGQDGIIFDVGHGAGSFDWNIAEKAIDQGLPPTTISTDLHSGSVKGPVYDLPTTMTKFLTLGFSMMDVVRCCTLAPAKTLGLDDRIGSLRPGYAADLTLLGWKEENTDLYDSYGNKRESKGVLYSAGVVKAGVVMHADFPV